MNKTSDQNIVHATGVIPPHAKEILRSDIKELLKRVLEKNKDVTYYCFYRAVFVYWFGKIQGP